MSQQYMTVEEVAELTRSTPSAVYQWRARGIGPRAFNIGKRLLFKPADVQAWIDSHSDESAHTADSVGAGVAGGGPELDGGDGHHGRPAA